MKKFFSAALVAVTAALALSCQKQEAAETKIMEETPAVHIVFADGGTKAFFDESSQAETFEKSLSSISILVFDKDNALIVRRNLTEAEVASKTCTFRLPKTVAGTNCTFVAIANYPSDDVKSISDLLALMDDDCSQYNGSFADVTTKAIRTGGFVMSGTAYQQVSSGSTPTEVALTLKRTVAKIALQTSISETFSQRYGGKLEILSATVTKGASKAAVISTEDECSSTATYTHSQDAVKESGKFNTLFYLYENEYSENREPALLEIKARYDIDGDDSTTDDQREFSYNISITGNGDGILGRNCYYRIAATVNGPEGDDCNVSINVSEWESPSTQNVNLGI